jgi:hypothetical protein
MTSPVDADRIREDVESLAEPGDPLELDVLLVSHLNQEIFNPAETPCHWLDDGGHQGLIVSTVMARLHFRHPRNCNPTLG